MMQKSILLLFLFHQVLALVPFVRLTVEKVHGKEYNRRSVSPLKESSSYRYSNAPVATSDSIANVQKSMDQLKRTLEREYFSFFDPMEREYYNPSVSFIDPLSTLSGVDSYQANVDMLSGRNFFGSLLFRDASISLHNIQGGTVTTDPTTGQIQIGELTTRWTLRFTFGALPWSPSPRFSGISKYTVVPGGPRGVQIVQQLDYWDAINLQPDGCYQQVARGEAVRHLVGQMVPGALEAPAAGPELPYQTLRIAKSYEVRRYPAYTAVRMEYERKDEAFSAMGAATATLGAMAPAVFRVYNDGVKTMDWPIAFANPGDSSPLQPPSGLSEGFQGVIVPESVVAIARFGDAIIEPIVRRVNTELCNDVARDGLVTAKSDCLMFAQYDAVFSMGKRRSEVHVLLDKHPW